MVFGDHRGPGRAKTLNSGPILANFHFLQKVCFLCIFVFDQRELRSEDVFGEVHLFLKTLFL